MIIPIILAGGTGSRLWPLSRKAFPKQFISILDSELSLFQQTVLRVKGRGYQSPIVVCNEAYRFLVAEQLRAIGVEESKIILEPTGRNTAPAIAIAALEVKKCIDEYGQLLVLPSDHAILEVEGFIQAVSKAAEIAKIGKLVTFGVKADEPKTGYGYIKQGKPLSDFSGFQIEKFIEKPDLLTAQRYLEDGGYLWNSGIFLFSAGDYLNELKYYANDIYESSKAAYSYTKKDLDFIRLPENLFKDIRSESIDYAVMEQTKKAAVTQLSVEWNDLGVWSSLIEAGNKDAAGNVVNGDVIFKDVKNSLVRAESRLVAAVGVEDVVIVETPDAVLVANKGSSQEIKTIVNKLSADLRVEADSHQRVYRPWGWYETICISERFQVKRIQVKPGSSLSLQMHHHRAEHWVIVKGTATITKSDKEYTYTEDQSTYIPLGTVHRLANPGVIFLEIIEIQTGSYLGEDDIVRFEDEYGREVLEKKSELKEVV